MRKGIYILPNLLTTGNLLCGFWAIISVFQEQYYYAAVAILLAAVFDAFDGKVAKLSGATSKFGVQYDSLADLVSFGVAPALLAFSWALRPYGKFGWLAAFTLRGLWGHPAGQIQRAGLYRRDKIFQRRPHPCGSCDDRPDHPSLPPIGRNGVDQGHRHSRYDLCPGLSHGIEHSVLQLQGTWPRKTKAHQQFCLRRPFADCDRHGTGRRPLCLRPLVCLFRAGQHDLGLAQEESTEKDGAHSRGGPGDPWLKHF